MSILETILYIAIGVGVVGYITFLIIRVFIPKRKKDIENEDE